MGAGWLNIGSLILGVAALVVPVASLVRGSGAGRPMGRLAPPLSFGMCAAAVCLQLFYTWHLVAKGDVSALMDTSGAVAVVAAGLCVATTVVNVGVAVLGRGVGRRTGRD